MNHTFGTYWRAQAIKAKVSDFFFWVFHAKYLIASLLTQEHFMSSGFGLAILHFNFSIVVV